MEAQAYTRVLKPRRAESSPACLLLLGTLGAGAQHSGTEKSMFLFALWLLCLLHVHVMHFLVKPRGGKGSVDTGAVAGCCFLKSPWEVLRGPLCWKARRLWRKLHLAHLSLAPEKPFIENVLSNNFGGKKLNLV